MTNSIFNTRYALDAICKNMFKLYYIYYAESLTLLTQFHDPQSSDVRQHILSYNQTFKMVCGAQKDIGTHLSIQCNNIMSIQQYCLTVYSFFV